VTGSLQTVPRQTGDAYDNKVSIRHIGILSQVIIRRPLDISFPLAILLSFQCVALFLKKTAKKKNQDRTAQTTRRREEESTPQVMRATKNWLMS
jgi:hypothetical protein